jgi:hypothetical protein
MPSMKLTVSAHFKSYGGLFTLCVLAVHWGNRVLGITVCNFVFELEY